MGESIDLSWMVTMAQRILRVSTWDIIDAKDYIDFGRFS